MGPSLGVASCDLGMSWKILGFASVGYSKTRKSMPRRREGRKKGSSLIRVWRMSSRKHAENAVDHDEI